jgi:hypothetical protein
MSLRLSELMELHKSGPLWQGLTKSGKTDPDVEDALAKGWIKKNPAGHGYVITVAGIRMLQGGVCPHCGREHP